jgi:hypothetical protein
MTDQSGWAPTARPEKVLGGLKDLQQTLLSPRSAKETALGAVLSDAIANTVYFVIGMLAIIQIAGWSRSFALALAGVEALLALIQFCKVLQILAADLLLFVLVLSGTHRREDDETEMLWASLIRIVQLGIWMSCLVILYGFFFP